jgi:hypothetical protein
MDKFKEELEAVIDLGAEAIIRFRAQNGGIALIREKIIRLDSDDSTETVTTTSGLSIKIEEILSINGIPNQINC